MIFVEDLMKSITGPQKTLHLLTSLLLPQWVIRRIYFGRKNEVPGDTATVIFSSGSTGEPKGVVLSHGNLASNTYAIYDIVELKNGDGVVGILPFFHSFGFTGTLWLPLLAGIKVMYHANPLDASTIGKLVEKHKGTLLMATPTFLSAYTRRCTKEQFASLKHVIVGAEKLKGQVADAFKEKFGIEPLEGYGATELSPVAALNIPDYREHGISQIGQKRGRIGRPLPGVAVKIVDPDTGEELDNGQEGLLLIKGPNVMSGYLNQPEKTAEVIQNGWYRTGDIANMDDDGFVTITDRLSRFSKIGGEMVPHIKIEEALQEAAGITERVFVVTSVPDEKKGEKIIVFYTGDQSPEDLVKALTGKNLPSLWIPKSDQFIRIEEIPLLGSGKLDLKAMKQKALELMDSKQ